MCPKYRNNLYNPATKNNTVEKSKKIGRGSEQTFFQRRQWHGQQIHKKMFNITNYLRNANQNHNEISHLLEGLASIR